MSKKRADQLTGFGITAAIHHAQALNEEHDQCDMIILRCGPQAFLEVLMMETYIDFLGGGAYDPRPTQYPGATGGIRHSGGIVLVIPDNTLGDAIYTIHDEDYQWSVGSWVEMP